MICSFLADLPTSIAILSTLAVICILGFNGAPIILWTMGLGAWLWAIGTPLWLLIILAIPTAFFLPTPLRAKVLTNPLMQWMKKIGFLPAISDTERTAIDAGTVWVDGDLFSGKPNFRKLMNEPYPELSEEEQAFVNGPTEEVCRITDDWDVWQRRDLSPQTWDFLKKNGFFGLIIPKEYGGHGFSAAGNSAIVKKLSSASGALGISVMVPNSLGPAELLMHYGTKEQKNEYLPKLASGEEMPAFALTEPGAGSDAAAMTSTGVLFKGDDGKIHLRLNWDKRYISLAGIATVLGLAFKLSDPDQLLGKGKELGITCALVPTTLPGITIGERHDPLGVPFWNCPTIGKDVVVGLDAIIGGAEGAGEGWRMLMECLAAGRGISLPASATAGTLGAARLTGAYSAVRKQFGLAIGRFEGIEEP
ncbi:MAG: acyl-CoA dehydrogenase family protein, partial [Planctomycetota bacterium]|nr:acyl-CoA dehydrogenase family protein [Planctomycetota bacterium]